MARYYLFFSKSSSRDGEKVAIWKPLEIDKQEKITAPIPLATLAGKRRQLINSQRKVWESREVWKSDLITHTTILP